MEALQDLQPSQLIRLLAKETITYYKLVGYGASVEECTQCNARIKQIEKELDARRYTEEQKMFQQFSPALADNLTP
jgi:Zn ribbon nucleic-acid-binding protein